MDPHQIEETLKTSFLFNFRTGNVLVDTLITGIIIYMSTYILKLPTVLSNLTCLLKSFHWFKTSEIITEGRKIQEGGHGTKLEYSVTFLAVLHKVKQLDPVTCGIRKFAEIIMEERRSYDRDDGGIKSNFIVSQKEPFVLGKDIYGQVMISHTQTEGKNDNVITDEFQIRIYSSILNVRQLRAFVENCKQEYEAYLKAVTEKTQFFFVYDPVTTSSDYDEDEYAFEEFSFKSNRTFDNIFYEEKELIKQRVDFFLKNKEWYNRRGIPYTIGFLFHGEPGCGKTSTIKALANYTKRHIISVPINRIKTCNQLRHVFYDTQINRKDIPLHKRLYVLEDIDCANLTDIVGDRGVEKNPSETENDNLLNMLKLQSCEFSKKVKTDKLGLSNLLELLDGVMEMEGRMIVITTNYPERLDKALIRPGRIDMKVNFGRCSSRCTAEMFETYFEMPLPTEYADKLPDKKWTPAELGQILLNNIDDSTAALEAVITQQPEINELQSEMILTEDSQCASEPAGS